MAYVWSKFEVFTKNGEALLAGEDPENVYGRGPVVVRESTNDNDDDGEPDGEIETWFLRYPDLAAAVEHTGVSRYGAWGHEVTVEVDGVRLEVGLKREDVPAFLAEIAANKEKAIAFERADLARRREKRSRRHG